MINSNIVLSRSDRAGLIFPVGRVHRLLRMGKVASRISANAPIFLAAAIERFISYFHEVAVKSAQNETSRRILPYHIQNAIRNDIELNELLTNFSLRDLDLNFKLESLEMIKSLNGDEPNTIDNDGFEVSRYVSFKTYIFKILKEHFPEYGISKKSMLVIESLTFCLFTHIAIEASSVLKRSGKVTLTSQVIKEAITLLMPNHLGDRMVEFAEYVERQL